MKHTYRTLVVALAVYTPCTAFATNGYQLIGVGAYQKSLGGAVTANPGSAMTAVTNPAGMARIGSRADFSMEAFMPEREAGFSATGGDTAESAVDMYGVPAIGWTAPVSEQNQDVFFGGGMYGTSGMGVDYAPTLMSPGVYWDGYSNISFWQMAPTVAWNQNERLSLGASLNIDYQSVAFRQRAMQDTTGDGMGDATVSNFDLGRSTSSFGLGFSFGMFYDLTKSIDLGFAYKSRQEFSDLEYQLAQGDITDQLGNPLPAGTYKLDLDYPQQASLGIAYQATPTLTVSADLKWIDWSDTMNKLTVEGPGVTVPMDPGWDDQTVYALGLAYAVNNRFNLRIGYNHADSPFGDEEVSRNLILPAVVEDHYTIGGDYRFNQHWELAAHYMYSPEETFTAPADDPIAPGAEIKLGETSFGLNVGYHF
ncbi:OmpP1/FadL family transporter [Thiohalomonas denitrificans]|uniref:OmpP1/FadL family transporter n=1 Tax=Thiohalomonas denitrificans TaxID=415747 RepID=UPI0026F25EA6|nr:outer membrane protein transport protein [Thiohalomonas denitrificans]